MSENYIDNLMNDHSLIEKALILLEREAQKTNNLNLKISTALIEFLWDYGDLFHNAKEEKFYFPLLLKKGMPPQGPIGVMLEEHKAEREYINKIRECLKTKENSNNLPSNFEQLVKDYAELTKNHIWKENDILYPMGKRFLKQDDENYLIEEFVNLEKDTVGAGAYQRYYNMLNVFELQTGDKITLLSALDLKIVTDMLDALPIELSFVDADDRVRYFNKLEKKKIFARTLSVIGRTVQQCHPQKSVHLVNKIITEMKEGKREQATFWINMDDMLVHISYYAVRDSSGNYEGCVEMVHDVQPYRELRGEKRLLDEK